MSEQVERWGPTGESAGAIPAGPPGVSQGCGVMAWPLQMGLPSSREQYIHRLGRTARAGECRPAQQRAACPRLPCPVYRLGRGAAGACIFASAAAAAVCTARRPCLPSLPLTLLLLLLSIPRFFPLRSCPSLQARRGRGCWC